jgi:hypothetical protein
MGVSKEVPALQLIKAAAAAAAGLACAPVVVCLYVGIKTRNRQHRLPFRPHLAHLHHTCMTPQMDKADASSAIWEQP